MQKFFEIVSCSWVFALQDWYSPGLLFFQKADYAKEETIEVFRFFIFIFAFVLVGVYDILFCPVLFEQVGDRFYERNRFIVQDLVK